MLGAEQAPRARMRMAVSGVEDYRVSFNLGRIIRRALFLNPLMTLNSLIVSENDLSGTFNLDANDGLQSI